MTWVRDGYCCRCGDCCVGNPFTEEGQAPSDYWKRKPEQPGRCPLLHFHLGNPHGDTSCVGHVGAVPKGKEDPYYMGGCIEWPTHPSHIEKLSRCTYTFRWVDDGKDPLDN